MSPNLLIVDDFCHPVVCKSVLEALDEQPNHVDRTTASFTEGDPPVRREYDVWDGQWVLRNCPQIFTTYSNAKYMAGQLMGEQFRGPISQASDFVIKRYRPGFGFLDWHRDLNAVSGVLYLNDCFGGATEFEDAIVKPRAGRLALFRGDMLHRATEVQSGEKVNIIMNFYRLDQHERPDTYDAMLGAS